MGGSAASAHPDAIHVRDFGAVPDDGIDDTVAIRTALAAAIASGRPTTVLFDSGTYQLTPDPDGGASLPITGAVGLTLVGAVGADGRPTTRLVGGLPLANDIAPATQFTLTDCQGLTMKNFVLDYSPRATSSGEVVSVDPDADEVVVDVFEDSTHFDGMRCYSANSWDLATRRLNRVKPLTIGTNPEQFANLWHSVAGGAGRRYRISGHGFSDRVVPGDGVSWHLNVVGGSYNIFALGCRDLRIDNLRIHNAVGVGMLAGYGHNVTLNKVVVEPVGDLAVGPRDAIHLSNSTGTMSVTDGYIKGVRWDPLVSRSSFLRLTDAGDGRAITVRPVSAGSRVLPFAPGDELTFWAGAQPSAVSVVEASPLDEAGTAFQIRLSADLPSDAGVGALLSSAGHEWTSASVTGTTIEDNIGTALVFMNRNLRVHGCHFANNAYHDIGLGTTSSGTGSFARDVEIRGNSFAGSGWVKKYSKHARTGSILTFANNGAFTNQPYNSGITIQANRFSDLETEDFQTGIYLRNARDVTVRNNQYDDVAQRVEVDAASTQDIDLGD
ncbi:right-handed parallel beta-helix repeat-containing protein [Occultella gossypii]|uniref:Right-handed parallel beta-helix repeat-containing protein n=1 Tax=Occultella gossypii TaxID=2800820 RepID=A0ABS7S7E5_9MICO|nr:right-handed parallel beta-helix repeat-containing protein [Occultella gossypii]MBZ2196279.1 right-handed parallel beta-helix repeat-containing protein [Occultella gossypii]